MDVQFQSDCTHVRVLQPSLAHPYIRKLIHDHEVAVHYTMSCDPFELLDAVYLNIVNERYVVTLFERCASNA